MVERCLGLTEFGKILTVFGKVLETIFDLKNLNSASFLQNKEALAGIWTQDLCLTKATLYQAELPRHNIRPSN
jgi:hypothetical protein